ncbi:hypothetical protein KL930_002246 [Ogataea haglerorum]|uniref:Uncharacterized protein n=1 Tax=Ogataea haglerorum TaxID=1937702 RepID=A0AAN6D800_9ASCO|nr:uncharacterized protein KL911_000149 [Ogataea haglerorum]KAG7698966.1 hypothetical protein KL915_001258 [Ogataea haglerorum]KAG7710008.1 hypothetical protein KL914_000918 [Ogataea haglerorum]KAG7711210.1 hypothetical protein KL950_001176 [Ogataea haglerorum]KAG7720508.1 hypothetical protein KL913_001408 [Ogataea haglerorum]KAG7720894.1 hypothetical protein KL949_001766 [Ogataea haglerorum]
MIADMIQASSQRTIGVFRDIVAQPKSSTPAVAQKTTIRARSVGGRSGTNHPGVSGPTYRISSYSGSKAQV